MSSMVCRAIFRCCVVAWICSISLVSFAQTTQYKPEHIENARENIMRYQWARDIAESWKRSVNPAMDKDREFFEDMISKLSLWTEYGQGCPVCVNKLSTTQEMGTLSWSINDPERLRCRYCGTYFPHPDYPETGVLECPQMGQTFTYWETPEERANPDDKTGTHALKWANFPVHTSMSGILRTSRTKWCAGLVLPLAKLYAVTGEVQYAEKAAMILHILADRYPNWLMKSYDGTYADCPPAEAARNLGEYPRAGRFPREVIRSAFDGRHMREDHAVLNNGFWGGGQYSASGGDGRFILNMVVAYDLIKDARTANGQLVISPEMKEQIVNDLLIAGLDASENWQDINNKCGFGRAAAAAGGILFNRPESVRWGIEGFEKLLENHFHFDGFCRESPSYSAMFLIYMEDIPSVVSGYSDPAGFVPTSGKPLKNYDPFNSVVRYRLALESMVRMLDPSNKYPVIGDTHFGSSISPAFAEILATRYDPSYASLLEEVQGAPLSEKGTEYSLWYRSPDLKSDTRKPLPLKTDWFPGWRVGVLRDGKGADSKTAFYFNGNEHGGHRHYDTLDISYTAGGIEFASDRGYIWDDTVRKSWTASTFAHNLVTVDQTNQGPRGCRSTLELFGTSPLLEIVQASANAYPQCDEYRRTCALISLPGDNTYVVDIFRVSGGKMHQYTLNSNGSLTAIKGADMKVSGREHRWLTDIQTAVPAPPFGAVWEYMGSGFEFMMLNPVDTFVSAYAPGWRSHRGDQLNAPPIRQIVAENNNAEKEPSFFVSLLVPHTSKGSPIKSAELLAYDKTQGVCAVKVELEDRTDYIISTKDDVTRTFGPVTMSGRFGFASFDRNGNPVGGYLIGGKTLNCGSRSINLPSPSVELRVISTSGRDYILASAPPPQMKPGMYVLVDETGLEIEKISGKTITIKDYPAVESPTITFMMQGGF